MVAAPSPDFERIRRTPSAKFDDDTTNLPYSAVLHYLELNAVLSQS